MLEMGRSAFQVLARQIGQKRRAPEQVRLATKLVVRRSTDPAYRDYQALRIGS
jgi:DNA-binding LacI/PurR family transcriptional regulator